MNRVARKVLMTRRTLALLSVLSWPAVALAQAPAGIEFRVNTYTTGHQYAPVAAFDREGDFVVVWSSNPDPCGGYGFCFPLGGDIDVLAQRYSIGGVPVGGEFLVNTTTAGNQYANLGGTPLAMRPDGRFVVVWSHSPAPGTGEVRGQRFEPDGSKVGAEFVVDPGVPNESYYANVDVAPQGTFVVVWASNVVTGDANVYGRIFDASGNGLGPAFRVNAATAGRQTAPRVAMDAQGGFVVAWQDRNGRDGSGHGVFAQRFGPAGQRLGAEFQVNTYTTGHQYAYSVARAPDGRFVVTWDSPADGDGFGAFARRYDAAGAPIGGEFQVNSATTGGQTYASVAVDDSFRMTVSWQSTTGDSRGFGLRGRRFDEQGAPVGGEFLVNSYTTYSQMAANVAMDGAGNTLVAWHSDRSVADDRRPGRTATSRCPRSASRACTRGACAPTPSGTACWSPARWRPSSRRGRTSRPPRRRSPPTTRARRGPPAACRRSWPRRPPTPRRWAHPSNARPARRSRCRIPRRGRPSTGTARSRSPW